MLRRLLPSRFTFQGGMFLPLDHEETADSPIQLMPMPQRLRVPLILPDGMRCRPIVQLGQDVTAYEILARAESDQHAEVFSPAAGKVTSLGRVDTAYNDDVPSVELTVDEPDSENWWREQDLVEPDPCTLDTLIARAEHTGAFSTGSPRAPLAATLRRITEHPIHTIIVNGIECEPFVTSTRRLLIEQPESVVTAASWLRKATSARRLWLTLDRDDRELLQIYTDAARRKPVRVRGMANKYPVAHPILLTCAITGRETPCGQEPFDLGVWVLNATDLVDLAGNAPVISRVVTITGGAIACPGNYRIPLGTTYEDILRHVGLKASIGAVIDGGPMTGRAITSLDCVITQETRAVLAIERTDVLIKRPGPCIRCGWCQDDCPVQLDPRAILNVVECEEWDHGHRLHPTACLECGLCSYICPSELPLAEAARKLKRMHERVDKTGHPGPTSSPDQTSHSDHTSDPERSEGSQPSLRETT